MRTMAIEAALTWAYRQELPKSRAGAEGGGGAGQSNWGAVLAYGALLARIDTSYDPAVNDFGCVMARDTGEPPHPDALAIGEAVAKLDSLELERPEGWNPIEDFGELGELGLKALERGAGRLWLAERDEDGGERLRLRTRPSLLVVKHAQLGGAPDWRGERPEVKVVAGPRGRPRWFRLTTIDVAAGGTYEIETDGWNEKRQRPWPDAYRKSYLDPDPAAVVAARGEYEVWRASLDLLAEALRGRLASIAVTQSLAARRPWETGEAAKPRILRAIRPGEPAPVTGARKRHARAS